MQTTSSSKRSKRGRPATSNKGKPILMEFDKPIDKYIRREGAKRGNSMVGIVAELLELRAKFKVWPPEDSLFLSLSSGSKPQSAKK